MIRQAMSSGYQTKMPFGGGSDALLQLIFRLFSDSGGGISARPGVAVPDRSGAGLPTGKTPQPVAPDVMAVPMGGRGSLGPPQRRGNIGAVSDPGPWAEYQTRKAMAEDWAKFQNMLRDKYFREYHLLWETPGGGLFRVY